MYYCTMYLCMQWQCVGMWGFSDAKLFSIGESMNLRNSICSLNLCRLDFLGWKSMDSEVRLRFETKCCNFLATCLERITLPSWGSVSLQTKYEHWSVIPLELPALRVSGIYWMIWIPHIHSLQGLNSNDWLLFILPQNIPLLTQKMIQIY